MFGEAHEKGMLNRNRWRFHGITENGLEIYENKETGRFSIYDPKTGDLWDD